MERIGNEAVATAMEWRTATPPSPTKVCKVCGEEKAETKFKMTRWGKRADVCCDCARVKYNETKQLHKMEGSTASGTHPFYDADFEGKQPVEVIQLMSRAKKWLESRGYEITLRGKYTITKEVKF